MRTTPRLVQTVQTKPPRSERDPWVQAMRLRGLAGLLRAADERLAEVTNLGEVLHFVSSTLDEIAEALDGGERR